MAPLDLRVRLLGAALRASRATDVTRMTQADIARAQQHRPKRTRLLDATAGARTPGVGITDRVIPGPGGPLRLRVYVPAGVPAGGDDGRRLVVNLHGGGWVLGNVEVQDWTCTAVAARLDAVVVSVDYRLAPAYRFPAAVEDCYAALCWVAAHAADLGADPARLGIMGDSAGGNLAAVTCLLARDRGGPGIRHQALIYPATDLTLRSPSLVANAHAPILNLAAVLAFRQHYLGEDGDPAAAYASPLLADLRGLPPALVQTAEHDPIRDDGARYAQRLRHAGVPVQLTDYAGMPHGYLSFPTLCRCAPEALAEIVREQAAHL